MKTNCANLVILLAALNGAGPALAGDAPKEKIIDKKPFGIVVAVKEVGPYMQAADLQIICLFKHKTSGDTYEGAAKATDEHLGGILSSLRNRGEFTGDLGETFLFTPPKGSIPARKFLIIGLGTETNLSLDSLHVVGRIAVREAVRLRAERVAWAPVIRDEGNSTLDVGDGDRAFVESMLSAYDTEKKLQQQGLSPEFSLKEIVIEAGPAYFDDAIKKVEEGIETEAVKINERDRDPYASAKK